MKMLIPRTTFGRLTGLVLVMSLSQPLAVWAGEGVSLKIDTGDTAWLLLSSALVLCMALPGLALFYGGLVRRKNVLGTIMHTLVILCLVSLIWVLCGYSLAFGPDVGGLIGGLDWVGSMVWDWNRVRRMRQPCLIKSL